MATRMQQRRGTSAEWAAANPILAAGELGIDTDTRVMKVGNGTLTWSALPVVLNNTYLGITAKAADSDKLDGFDSNVNAVVNTVPVRDASGDVTVRSVHSELATLSTTPNFLLTQNAVGTGAADNMARPVTLAQLKTSLGKMLDSELLDGLDSTAFVLAAASDNRGRYSRYFLSGGNV